MQGEGNGPPGEPSLVTVRKRVPAVGAWVGHCLGREQEWPAEAPPPPVSGVQVGHRAPGGYALPPGRRRGWGAQGEERTRADSGTQKQKPREESSEKALGHLLMKILGREGKPFLTLFPEHFSWPDAMP